MRIKVWSFFILLLACMPVSASAQLIATPDPLDFGDVILTEIKDDQLVLQNTGATDILITNFSLTTPGNGRPSEFEILLPTIRTFLLTAGASRTITFRFAPDFEGQRNITLFVETDQGNFSFGIKGNGLLTHPELTLSTNNINFGKVSVSGRKEVIVDIANVGEDDAKISDVNVANFSGVEHFKVEPEDLTKPFPIILSQGESTKLRVIFEGAAPLGFKSGNITLVGSVGGQTMIDLSGEVVGADLLISPDPIDFGDVEIGMPVTKIVTITALSEEPIEIDYINELFAPFAYVTPPPVPLKLQPGVPYQLEIQLTADAPGPITSQIQFVSEDFTGSNFKGVNITANGKTPVHVAASDDFTFYCGAKKVITRTAMIENRGIAPITIQSYVAPTGVTVQTGTPLQVPPAGSSQVIYEFDPSVSAFERDFVIEYLGASAVLVRDTIHVTPITADIDFPQEVVTNGLDVHGVHVASSFDFTDFEVRDMDFEITFYDPDMFKLVKDSVKLDPQLLPNATHDLIDNGAGSYTLQIRSATPVVFDPSVALDDQHLFSYSPIAFAARETSSFATAELVNTDLCAELSIDSITLFSSEFCGDDLVRGHLSDIPLRDLMLTPNPVTAGYVRLELVAAQQDEIEMRILDMRGVEVKRMQMSVAAGDNHFMISTSELADGAYAALINSKSLSFRRELKFVVRR